MGLIVTKEYDLVIPLFSIYKKDRQYSKWINQTWYTSLKGNSASPLNSETLRIQDWEVTIKTRKEWTKQRMEIIKGSMIESENYWNRKKMAEHIKCFYLLLRHHNMTAKD